MNRRVLAICILLGALVLSACAASETQIPSVTESVVGADEAGFYPLSTRTGVADIDVILAAVESRDPQQVRDLLRFNTIPCTTADGLGGPPKCRDGEADGALVEVFPFLGGEGSYLYKENVDAWAGVDVTRLYAIYRNSENIYSDEFFPAGEFSILFLSEDNFPGVALQVTDGQIVRIATVFDTSSQGLSDYLQVNASEMLLPKK